MERGQQLAEQILAFQRQQTADQIQLSILQNALAVNPLAADVREKNREIEKLQGVIADRDQSIQSLTSKNLQLVVRVGSLQKAAATHQTSERALGSTLTERDLKLWIEQSSGSKPSALHSSELSRHITRSVRWDGMTLSRCCLPIIESLV